jgi:hypothetical protein
LSRCGGEDVLLEKMMPLDGFELSKLDFILLQLLRFFCAFLVTSHVVDEKLTSVCEAI